VINESILRDPTAEKAPTERARLEPPAKLDGLTVALLDIGKARGDEYVDRLQTLLSGRGIAWRRYRKPTNTRTAPVELIQQITRECQVAVIALSD
jgi:hypothetical protein